MTAKKTLEAPKANNHISDSNFTINNSANEYTVAAIEALASAAAANANAIAEIARALKGSDCAAIRINT